VVVSLEVQKPDAGQFPAAKAPGPKLLFLVGMWRSGTSLLQTLLNQHPQVALMYEAEPLDLWPRRRVLLGSSGWPQRLEFFNQTISRHRLDPAHLAWARPGRAAALELYRQYAARRGAQVQGEKAPAYHRRLPFLARLFPEARFLIVWRDPLACCRSAARAGTQNRFFAQRGMMTRILFGSEALALGVEWLRKRQRLVHEVIYEELVKDTEADLRKVCDFLEIPYAAEMLKLEGADVSSVPSGEHHSGVRSGVIETKASATDPLTADFACKGQRYFVLWRQRYSNLGFARALPAEGGASAPGTAERLADAAALSSWRTLDCAKRILFRHLPLSWWGRLRSSLPRAHAPSKAAP